MAVVRAEIEIDASPERVFDALADVDAYSQWNPFTPQVESTLRVGDPIHMRVRLQGEKLMRQTEYVTANERPHKLCWGANIGPRILCRADRCQVLTPLEGDRTRYVCTDEIRGLLTPLVMLFYGAAMKRGFEDCALALKKRVES